MSHIVGGTKCFRVSKAVLRTNMVKWFSVITSFKLSGIECKVKCPRAT